MLRGNINLTFGRVYDSQSLEKKKKEEKKGKVKKRKKKNNTEKTWKFSQINVVGGEEVWKKLCGKT